VTSLSGSAVSSEMKKGRRASAVAAVRGDPQFKKELADPSMVTLKNPRKDQRMKGEAAKSFAFAKALDLVQAGKQQEGLAALQAFQKENPTFKTADVAEAIAAVEAMIAEGPAAETKVADAEPAAKTQ